MLISAQSNNVLLIHGLWNRRIWLFPLACRLQAYGFKPQLFGYASVSASPTVAVERLIARLRRSQGTIDVIGHSLGGLIALEALRQAPDVPINRLVCLGSPLKGSQVARRLANYTCGTCLLGCSRELLSTGIAPWHSPVQVGMIAGQRARGLGRIWVHFAGKSDGTVALEETYLPGLTDHCVVDASHSGLVLSTEVTRQCVHFLQQGHFAR